VEQTGLQTWWVAVSTCNRQSQEDDKLGVGRRVPILHRKNVTQYVTKLHKGPQIFMNEIWFLECENLHESSSLKILAKDCVKYKLDLV
jgi:hypothetical protein